MPSSPPLARFASGAQNPAAGDAHRLGRWFAGVRRAGWLALLSPPAWITLCALLSFTGRDGAQRFTLEQLALALGTSREEAERWLLSLVRTDWQGSPLLQLEQASTGEVTGAQLAELTLLDQVSVPGSDPMPISPAELTSHSSTTITERSQVVALTALGLTPAQVDRLREHYAPDRIQRQLEWLPARGARNPAALLVRAVEGDWEAPTSTGERKRDP